MAERRYRSRSPVSPYIKNRRLTKSSDSRTPSPQVGRRRYESDGRSNENRRFESRHGRYENQGRFDRNEGADNPEEVGYRIHIGDIVKKTSEDQLKEQFVKYGPIKEVFLANTFPQFAIVSFTEKLDAEDAIRDMDGNFYNGSKISVSYARPRARPRGNNRLPPSRASCYKCGKIGHFAKECDGDMNGGSFRDDRRDRDRMRGRDFGRDRDNFRDRRGGYGGDRGGGGGRATCYNCGRAGHFARDCDSAKDSRSYGGGRSRNMDYDRNDRYDKVRRERRDRSFDRY